MIYDLIADAVLVVHFLFVAFVVIMLPCIFLGAFAGWRWVRILWLRVLHLAAICIVSAEAWARVICPLTTFEMWLRGHGDPGTYSGGFIEHWLQKILYWELPSAVFILAYSLFALLVILAWMLVPPARPDGSGGLTR